MRVVRHPSSTKALRDVGARWFRLRDEHRRASEHMWLGMIASEFTDTELDILGDFLTPNDRALLRRLGDQT